MRLVSVKKLATEAEYWIPRNDRSWTRVTNTRNHFGGLFRETYRTIDHHIAWRKDQAQKQATVDDLH